MVRRKVCFVVSLCLLTGLGGCATQGQSRYSHQEVGKASIVEFGAVIASRKVDIRGQNTGVGGAVGGVAGGLAMSNVGQGSGNTAAILGGVLVGAALGAMAEQAASDRIGIEYIITLSNGKTITIVQEQGSGERVFNAGERVMVQATGNYQRVLPADHLPAEISRPKGINVIDK